MRKFAVAILGVLVAVLTVCSVCFAEVTTITSPPGVFSRGWNLFALPAFPTQPAPGSLFDELGGNEGLGVRGVSRWDAPTQQLLLLSASAPGDFGNILPGDGYWVRLKTGDPTTISFTGIADQDGTDMWISLPCAGWTLIGYPYSYPAPDSEPGEPFFVGDAYPWESVSVTDGTVTKTLYEASQRGARWISSNAYWFDSMTQGALDIGLPEDFPMSDSMVAWHGYWVKSYKDNLALIMEARKP